MNTELRLAVLAILSLLGCAKPVDSPGFGDEPPAMDAAAPAPPAPMTDASTSANEDAPYVGGGYADGPAGSTGPQYPTHPTPPPAGVVSSGNVPPDPAGLFGGATVDPSAPAPTLAYPTPETMFPPNMPNILFQWKVTAGNLFRLHFAEGTSTLDVYTDGRNATCDQAGTGGQCWESAPADLMLYFGNASDLGQDVTFTIAALDTAAPGKMTLSPAYTLHVARTDITGAVYYWSTTAQGIRRGNFGGPAGDGGTIARPAPVDYITNSVYPPTSEGASVRCAACHTLSRDGKKLAVSLYGDVLGIIDIVAAIPPPMTFGPPSKGFTGSYIGSSWSAFRADDARIVTATTGVMTVRDVDSGAPIGGDAGVIALPSGIEGSMPDWSPDTQSLVFAATPNSAPNTSYGRHLYGSSIAMLAAQGDGFTGYQVVAASVQNNCQATLDGGVTDPAYTAGARETYANPMFSNDSKWLVFSRAECESEDDPTAEVILAPAAPNAPQNHLLRANRQVASGQVTNVTNGMPVWGPTNDPKIAWIAFTSTRDYGLVLTPGSKSGSELSPPFPGSNVRQLWIAAVDMSQLTSGNVSTLDPSYPAFRFSAQGLEENNHRPFWTVDTIPQVNVPPPPPK